ncbi:MAG: type II toxin-antitoxin system RelE/ParE family toxin [Clostridiales bacterium]|jgi:mRNA-degrading endonuclease RelE of RelBE toxin-antitoxin system|nr:type II toxin-antitoxin system RelE/ParE family toxin [Clostridiales bacterium]
MMLKIQPTSRFKRLIKKLPEEIKERLKDTLRQLQENPKHPSLRSKPYKSIPGVFESSINMKYRILWEYDTKTKTIIILLAVGDHDIL